MNHKEVSKAYALVGSIGGRSGTGASKARTTKQARAAAMVRWAKHKSKRGKTTKQKP